MQDNDDANKQIGSFSESDKRDSEKRLEAGKLRWIEDWPVMISKDALQMIVEIINANAFCSLSRDAEIVQKLRNKLVEDKILKITDTPHIGCCDTTR